MILQRGIEAIRREAMRKTQAKLKEQTNFQSRVDAMSKHDVGGMYDLRAIAKSKQFKEQDNHYSTEMAMTELETLLSKESIIQHKQKYLDYLKTTGRQEFDSFQIRELGKLISEICIDVKIANDVKIKWWLVVR